MAKPDGDKKVSPGKKKKHHPTYGEKPTTASTNSPITHRSSIIHAEKTVLAKKVR